MTISFSASVSREGDWWVIDVHDVGVTQCAERDEAEATAVDLIAAYFNIDPSVVRVSLIEVAS